MPIEILAIEVDLTSAVEPLARYDDAGSECCLHLCDRDGICSNFTLQRLSLQAQHLLLVRLGSCSRAEHYLLG